MEDKILKMEQIAEINAYKKICELIWKIRNANKEDKEELKKETKELKEEIIKTKDAKKQSLTLEYNISRSLSTVYLNIAEEEGEEVKKEQIAIELDYKYSMALFDTIKKIQCDTLDEELNKYLEKFKSCDELKQEV